ncbi:hypothetical protein [Glaciimonas sp. PAMC28666]|uniref:hypothetical protein n=1 Tax=Glaciimonas sp. PAMC28666 TaxID=2807626 RepID=UPI001962A88A|nr:hypothetical protein [Glaciimonas sp. PAMC28666]QRX82458.1 hypothetical protein JQN73_20655 [Glaciimonas sp. PAMC28666]
MSDNVDLVTADDFLPVGMLANGRGPAKAMESVAKRKHNVDGWEPFHYEQISATEFEVTGGIPAIIGGAKKWPEPHTSVIILDDELTQELQLILGAQPTHGEQTVTTNTVAAPSQTSHVVEAKTDLPTQSKYMTVILRMPDDTAGHRRIAEMLALNKNFFGADVVATAFQDDFMVSKTLLVN